MDAREINAVLYRPLQPKNIYDALIPKYLGVEHHFEKPLDYSDTFGTLAYMAKWSEKYASQMDKVAPLLKGKTLKQTVDNIYNFLYSNFQYRLDGQTQQLYSPSAAWHYRDYGIDCKSYSILASTILSDLSIAHAFRMVKQKGVMTGQWSHVYVVVPDGNKYHVIHATRHVNTEVSFTAKYDFNMKTLKHIGLAMPYPATPRLIPGMGCPCQGKPLAKSGLGNPAQLNLAIIHFHEYLDQLESRGVSRSVTNKILDEVRRSLHAGIDPNMAEVLAKAVARRYGLGGEDKEDDDDTTAGAVQSGAAAAQSVLSVAQSLIPKNLIGSTFGAVFANGFDVSCWGASLTPQKAGAYMKTYHNPYFTYITNKINAAKTIAEQQEWVNKFLQDVYQLYAFYTIYKPKDADWSSCAKKGIAEYVKYMTALKGKGDQLVVELQSKGAEVSTARFQPLKFTFPKSMTGAASDKVEMKGGRPESFVDYPVVKMASMVQGSSPSTPVDTGNNVVQNPDGTKTITSPDGSVTVMDPQGNIKSTTPKPPPTKKDIPLGAIAGVGALAFLFLMPKFKDGQPALGRPRTKTRTKAKTHARARTSKTKK